MLIRPFKIERRRPFEVVALFQHKGMGRPGIEPNVQYVLNHLKIVGIVVIAKEARGIAREPNIGPFPVYRIDNALVDSFVAKHFARLFVHEQRERNAPGTLARDNPIGPRFHHGPNAVLGARRVPFRFIDRRERLVS